MKKFTLTLVTVLMASGCRSQELFSLPSELRKAARHGAKAKMTLNVIDERGNPVTNAIISVTYGTYDYQKIEHGATDANGLYVAEGVSTRRAMGGKITKDRYYDSFFKFPYIHDNFEAVKDGRWLPWNPTIPVILREIRNPISMYVKQFEGTFGNGETVGFDCKKGDFVEPHGKGSIADFMIRVDGHGTQYENMTKEISLDALDPDGGFMICKWHEHSAFKSEYLAPESGYTTNLFVSSFNDATKKLEEVVLYHGGNMTRLSSGGEYLIFKSRIKRDTEGKIISANYGKIYSNFEFMGREQTKTAWVKFVYYYNPTPNDCNLEFDGKNNLFRPDLQSSVYIP